MKYNKFQKRTSVPVSASESVMFMVNLAKRTKEHDDVCMVFSNARLLTARLGLKQCQSLPATSGSILFLTEPIEFVTHSLLVRTKSVDFFLPQAWL
jgi:hypothetical protein